MTWAEFAYLSGGEQIDGIDVIAEASRLANVGKGSSCEDGISGKEHSVAKFIDTDGARGMSRGMYHLEAIVSQIKMGSILQPEMDL